MELFYSYVANADSSAAVRKLLAHVFAAKYNRPMPEISKTEAGKPYFAGEPEIHFSLTHTKGLVACAIGNTAVGVDAELAARSASPRLVRRIASEAEREQFDFIELWTLKECYIKLHGLTSSKIRSVRFRRETDGSITAPEANISSKVFRKGEYIISICSTGALPADAVEIKLD